MNLYESTVTIDGDGGTVTVGSQTLSLDASVLAARPALRNYDGKRVVLGIRPEDFEDAALAGGGGDGRVLTAKVTLLEALGSEIMVHFRLDATRVDSGDPDAVEEAGGDSASNAVGRFSPRSTVRMGETAQIAVSTENAHFFDHDTRQAIWD
jgi:multiple sugar transport system ATP-binding protein